VSLSLSKTSRTHKEEDKDQEKTIIL